MMEKENKELFLTQLTNSPVWERFNDWFYYDQNFYYKNTTYGDTPAIVRELPESFQLAALVDWLDTQRIYISPTPLTTGMFNYEITSGEGEIIMQYDYTSRSEALKAGIIKGFSLLEKKI